MEDTLIYSSYNFLFKTSQGVPLLYNSEHNNLLELTLQLYDVLELASENNEIISSIDDEIRNKLINNGILVNANNSDSLKQKLYDKYIADNINNSTLNLTILPTYNCNFNCSYCFEGEKHNSIMSQQVINELIQFIKTDRSIKNLSILWFGGEPLLAYNIIGSILKKIELEINIPIISHGIITNGYCINEKICTFLKDYKISYIQITLDGIKTTHDKFRKLKKTNHGTYDTIISNIWLLLEKCPNIKIKIRINVSQSNFGEYWDLKKELLDLFKSDAIEIYPGFIFNYNSSGKLVPPSLERSEMIEFYLKSDNKLFPSFAERKCAATDKNGFVIAPDGGIYKCLKDLNNPKKIIAYLNGKKENENLEKLYASTSCFKDKKCLDCFFLPICSGGCCNERIKNMYENADLNLCTLYKDSAFLQKCLENYYINRKQILKKDLL